MQETATVQCPWCGQDCEIAIDCSIPSQSLTTDCEVCCRPFTVHAECEEGEIRTLEAASD